MQTLPTNKKGFTLLGIVIAVAIFAAFGSALTLMVATNQRTRVQILLIDQAFASTQAGFEFALRKKLAELDTSTSFTRSLVRGTITIDRSGGLIKVTTTQEGATAAYQIADPP